mgnify:CR=1 FL=1
MGPLSLKPSRRRAALGIPLVLHLLWVAAIAAPAMSAESPAVANADVAAMPSMPHCHEAMMASGEVVDMANAAPSQDPAPAHAPCCADECHCAGALGVVLFPARSSIAMKTATAPLLMNAPPDSGREQPDRDLRPPIR